MVDRVTFCPNVTRFWCIQIFDRYKTKIVTRFWPNVTQFSSPIYNPNTIFFPFTSKSSQTLPKFPQNPNPQNS